MSRPRQMLTAYSLDVVSRAAEFRATAGGFLTDSQAISRDGPYVAFASAGKVSADFPSGMEQVYRYDRVNKIVGPAIKKSAAWPEILAHRSR
jgi:hypothetical protein